MVPFADIVRRRSAGLVDSGDNFISMEMSIYSVILLHKLLQIWHYNLMISSVISVWRIKLHRSIIIVSL